MYKSTAITRQSMNPFVLALAGLLAMGIVAYGLEFGRPSMGSKSGPSIWASLPTTFVENQGQWRNGSRFAVRRGAVNAALHADRIRFELAASGASRKAFELHFVASSEATRLSGERQLAGEHAFFLGNDKKNWCAHVKAKIVPCLGGPLFDTASRTSFTS